MQCITSSFSMLVNGIPGEPFRLEPGTWQEILSFYIFLFYILRILIGIFILWQMCRNLWLTLNFQIIVNYPLFNTVDNWMIFCKENRTGTKHMKDILENYCNVLVQLVNYHKPMGNFLKGTKTSKTCYYGLCAGTDIE